MIRRASPETAFEIARVRQLQLQRALADSSRARTALDHASRRMTEALAAQDAHFDAWREAAGESGRMSIALLDNFARALEGIASERRAAREALDHRRREFDASRHALAQLDRLTELANEDASRASRRHRQAIEERRLSERESRPTPSTEDQ
ncbi:hypothetical protein [Burkholderia ambifaria]|uniref:hypothetical protein n=1 Tax=Burkholderia ambifaria TaxID=152480 RepID=UPI00158F5EA3|nr:hypothetical protein [Burkholderia ambifaria]